MPITISDHTLNWNYRKTKEIKYQIGNDWMIFKIKVKLQNMNWFEVNILHVQYWTKTNR